MGTEKKKPIRVAYIGNSITYGIRLQNLYRDSYPAILEQLLGTEYDVRNFGVSGRTMLQKGDYPYGHERTYADALDFCPDIVTSDNRISYRSRSGCVVSFISHNMP